VLVAARYRWDDFTLDLDRYRLDRKGVPLSLEPKAFDLLALMVSQPGHIFTRQEIFDTIWPGTAVTDHALTRVIEQLRRVLGDDVRDARYLETVPTRGYRWIRPVEILTSEPVARPPLVAVFQRTAEEDGPPVDVPAEPVPPAAQPWWRSRVAVATVVLVLVAAALVWSQLRQRQVAPLPDTLTQLRNQSPVQLTTHAGLDLNPSFSPQGDAIAFASDRTGAFEIHVRSFGAGATDVAVTSDGGQNVQPAWSPDGRLLAYHSAVHGGVWIVPARGGVARQLVPQGSSPEWSPDGRRIVFQSGEHPDITPTGAGAQVGSTLWLIDAGGGTPVPLTSQGQPPGGHGAPAWSRDGRFVVFSVFDGGADNGVWVVRVDTRGVTPVDRGVRAYETVFAENDTALYVAAGEPVIFRLSFDPQTGKGTGARDPIVISGVAGARGLSVTADGRQLAFAGIGLSSHIWAQPVDADGQPSGAAYALTTDTSRRNYMPAISPDGSRVAYMSARRGEPPNIWVMDLATRAPMPLTDDAFDRRPLWFPDGSRIAYASDRPDGRGFFSIDIATRRAEAILRTDRLPDAAVGSDSLSGRLAEIQLGPSVTRAAFSMAVLPYGYRRMYVAGFNPFAPRALTDGSISVGYPAWSRDERRLAVEIQQNGATELAVIDLESGELRPITNDGGQVRGHSWSPDGRRVVAAVLRDGRWSLEWFEVKTGARGPVVPPGPASVYYRYPEWSPKGDLIAFERAEVAGNIWRLTLPDPR
jgi:Tol biopolymer transport system component/DNA-binding winged helix-turn-helix (wHTH) protein